MFTWNTVFFISDIILKRIVFRSVSLPLSSFCSLEALFLLSYFLTDLLQNSPLVSPSSLLYPSKTFQFTLCLSLFFSFGMVQPLNEGELYLKLLLFLSLHVLLVTVSIDSVFWIVFYLTNPLHSRSAGYWHFSSGPVQSHHGPFLSVFLHL